jgi:aryl-alcohol dehydrogenase-like predicted oxidoreductase
LIGSHRDSLVLATKYTLTTPENEDPNAGGNSRKNMVQSIERSLERLQTDYIDLFYLHMWDYLTPVQEVMRALDDLVRRGLVHYVGISDAPSWVVAEANTLAELRGWSRFAALQIPYTLLDRSVERAMLPLAKQWGMAVLPWGILASGVLTGKFRGQVVGDTRLDPDSLDLPEKTHQILDVVQRISQEGGRPMSQVAINWVRQSSTQPMIPIIGARTVEQLADNLAALAWRLSEEQMTTLNEVSQIDLGFPHSLLPGNRRIFGNTYHKIDNHH